MRRWIAPLLLLGMLAGCGQYPTERDAKSKAWHQAMRDDLTEQCATVRAADKIMVELPMDRDGMTAFGEVREIRAKLAREYNADMAKVQPVLMGGTYGLPAKIVKHDLPDCDGDGT